MRRKIIGSMTAVMLSAIMLLSGILTVPLFEPTQLNAQIFEDSINNDAILLMNDEPTNQTHLKEGYEENYWNIDLDQVIINEWEEMLNPLSPLNLTELNRAISDAQIIVAQGQGLIPRPQWATLRLSLDTAIAVRNNVSSTQAQVNVATNALRDAINSVSIFVPPILNLAALNAAIAEAQAMYNGGQGDVSRARWAMFRAALADAIAVRNNTNATQAQVNEATNNLREIINDMPYVFITLNPNGGAVNPQTLRILRGDTIDTLPTPTRSGAGIFIGWSTVADGGVLVATGQTATQDATFHARWTNPNRHLNYWTRPTSPTLTEIFIQNINMLGPEDAGLRSAMQSSMNSWNNSDTPVQVVFDDLATVTTVRQTVDEGDFRLGTFLPVPDNVVGPNLHGFRLTLNSFQIRRHARLVAGPGADDIVVEHVFYRLITHVFAHEIGHTVGLADDPRHDNGYYVQLSIMNNFLNPHGPILAGPQPFDVDSVNLIYR